MNPQLVNFGLPTTGQFSAAVDINSVLCRGQQTGLWAHQWLCLHQPLGVSSAAATAGFSTAFTFNQPGLGVLGFAAKPDLSACLQQGKSRSSWLDHQAHPIVNQETLD
jgi:hypothetical protein